MADNGVQKLNSRKRKKVSRQKPCVGSASQVEVNVGSTINCTNDPWIFDTAASHHFCRNRKLFLDFTSQKGERLAVAIDGVSFPIKGYGSVKMKFGDGELILKNVMFSPRLRRNIVSGSKLDEDGFSFQGGNGKIVLTKDGHEWLTARLHKGVLNFYCQRF